MLLPNSRYKSSRPFERADGARGEPFPGLRPRAIGSATGVIEHVVREGDRLDHLARHYYNDERLWWRILDANPQITFGGGLMPSEDDRSKQDSGDSHNGDNRAEARTVESFVGQVILIPPVQET